MFVASPALRTVERKLTAPQENLFKDTPKKAKENIYALFHSMWEKRVYIEKTPQKKKTKEQQDALKVLSLFST
jgi:hypothetical protein